VSEPAGTVSTLELLRAAARRTFRPPFFTLLVLSVLVVLVGGTVTDPDSAFFTMLVLLVIENYINIAVILAGAGAGAPGADVTADTWIRAAFRRRTFWRYLGTSLLASFVAGLGFVFLIVPGFIAAGRLGLGPVIAVLENSLPGDALRRSGQLSESMRGTVAVAFGLFQVLPSLALGVASAWDPEGLRTALLAGGVVVVFAERVGTLTLVDVFMRQGGNLEPTRERRSRP
jgi:hypothetical protein